MKKGILFLIGLLALGWIFSVLGDAGDRLAETPVAGSTLGELVEIGFGCLVIIGLAAGLMFLAFCFIRQAFRNMKRRRRSPSLFHHSRWIGSE